MNKTNTSKLWRDDMEIDERTDGRTDADKLEDLKPIIHLGGSGLEHNSNTHTRTRYIPLDSQL